MIEVNPSIVVCATSHDVEGRQAEFFPKVDTTLTRLYTRRLISFTDKTSLNTVDAAIQLGWDVEVVSGEQATTNKNRLRVIERGVAEGGQFINYWDGDRLLHASVMASDELVDLAYQIPKYDLLIVGATEEGIKTHQSSMVAWEAVKSWRLGRFLGINGDIANRGCFGFSREYATFLVAHQSDGDESEALFTILALVYQKLLGKTNQLQQSRGIGYKEYPNLASYEDWLFEGLTSEESARRKNTLEDFNRRGEHVGRILKTAEEIAAKYGLA